jgi:uncharacterized Zn finger protein
MNVDEATIQKRCTDAGFERGVHYRDEGRIQSLDRFDDLVTASVQGSNLYDVTVEFDGRDLETRCTCPYDGSDDCKHVVAVLLAIAASPPRDESEDVETVLADVPPEEVRAFVWDALAENAELRDRFLARFGDDHKSVDEYREEIGHLFETHADPVVFEAIDFSRFFEVAEQYRDRERYLAAGTVYRAIFEEVDERYNLVDGAYDHYARTIQRALDGYVECVLATDPNPEAFNTYAGVLEACASREPPINGEQFRRALDDLEDRYDER